jgi:hypothetical protein
MELTQTTLGIYYPTSDNDDRFCIHYPASGEYYFRLWNDTKDLIGRGINNYHGENGTFGPTTYYSFIRFNNVTIPKRAIIVSAVLILTARLGPLRNRYCNALISFENADNPSVPISHDDMEARVRTSDVEWNDIGPWMGGVEYKTPELKTILQTIVDRNGFVSGNSVIAYIRNNNSDEDAARIYCTHNYNRFPWYPKLSVEWSSLEDLPISKAKQTSPPSPMSPPNRNKLNTVFEQDDTKYKN